MRKYIFTLCMLMFVAIGYAQVISTKYYQNEWSTKEVAPEKAKFVETISKDKTGAVTTELRNVKKNKIVQSETYKDEEPYGTWIYQRGSKTDVLDYSFSLNYDELLCTDSIPGINNYFENNDTLKYRAPTLEGGEHIFQFIAKAIVYPTFAKENVIEGKVVLRFIITADGAVEQAVIVKGNHIVLDKEAARVIRMLKFANPPMLNGQQKKVCVTFPITFRLS